MRMRILALALAVACVPATAEAQRRLPQHDENLSSGDGPAAIERISPRQLQAVLRHRGLRAEIVTENNRTRLRTEIAGRRVSVLFYSCNAAGCQSYQYRAAFQRHERFTPAFVNAWNFEKRFAKTYLDREGDLLLEWDVDLEGGVTVGFVAASVGTFETMIRAFDTFQPRSLEGGEAGRSANPGGAGRSPRPGAPPLDAGRSANPGLPPGGAGRSVTPGTPPPPAGTGRGEGERTEERRI